MIVRDLSAESVATMPRVDITSVEDEPPSPMEEFEFHGCTCGVASNVGQGPWELHTEGDELLHVLSGEMELFVREEGGDVSRVLRPGHVAVVPKGCWHRGVPAPDGVTFLFLTPTDGNRHSMDDPRSS